MANIPFSRLMVYLDGSEGSLNALMYGIVLAKALKAELHAVYIINTKAVGDLFKSHIFIASEKDSYLDDLRQDSNRYLKHARKLASSKDVDIITKSIEGSPHVEVLEYIKQNDIDLLLLGSINKIRSRRDELTSENDRMLRTVQCPVMVVRDDLDIWSEFEEV